ncbi:MAG: FG-GAP repeat domain-containing protein, partial [Verrucomicrobiota bacterium]
MSLGLQLGRGARALGWAGLLLLTRAWAAEVPLAGAGDGRPGFTRLSPEQTGLHFTNPLPASRWLAHTMLLNGSGVAAGDLDGDGRPDLVFGSLAGRVAFFRNLGAWRFEDRTARWGAALPEWPVSGVALADLDG